MCSNLPDDWDQAAFDKAYETDFVRCVDCEHLQLVEGAMAEGDNEQRVNVYVCTFDGIEGIPDEGGCEQ